MSLIHLARQGFITKSALPNVTRQRGTTSAQSNLMLYGAGKTTVSNNTTFVDSSTNALTVSRFGDTVQSGFNPFSGVSNGSGFFDGTGDYLTVPSNSAFQYGTGNFTVEFWVYATAYPTTFQFNNIFDARGGNFAQTQISISFYNTGSVTQLLFESGASRILSPTYTPAVNTWAHVAFVRNSGTITCYVNGTSVASAALTTNYTASYTSYVASYDGTQSYVRGYLSNFRIVNGTAVYTSNFTPPTSPLTAITNTSLLLLMENYSVVNSTSTNRLVTLFGNTTISTAQFPTGMDRSIFFDGNGDYLTLPDNADFNMGTSNFTLECFIYLSSAPGIFATIINKDGKNAVSWPQYALYVNNNYRVNFSLSSVPNTTPSPTVLITGATTLALNTWYHVAATRSGTSATLWVNGVSDGTSSSVPSTLNNGARPLYVGWEDRTTPDTAFNFPGYISNLRVVKGTAVYTAAFTTPTAPLSVTVSVPNFVTNSIYGVYQLA
jgi:hypothetical protein